MNNIFLKFQCFEIARLSHYRNTYLCQCVKHDQHFWKALGIFKVQYVIPSMGIFKYKQKKILVLEELLF